MAESSPLQSNDEYQLLQTALEHPFEPTEVPSSSPSPTPVPLPPIPTPTPPPQPAPLEASSTEDDAWQSAYSAQVSEWRAQSASARTKAEFARAKWESIRAREREERQALGQPPESWVGLGDHITASVAAADEVVSHSLSASVSSLGSVGHEPRVRQEESAERVVRVKTESGSPSQPWEHLSSSPTSSYPSMSFPDASVPQSPTHQHALLAPAPAKTLPRSTTSHNPTYIPPSTLPSIMDSKVAPRTRLSLVLTSLAINLLLPFINGVMLGFGEIFAKDVIVGWFGWKKRPGSTAAGLGLWR